MMIHAYLIDARDEDSARALADALAEGFGGAWPNPTAPAEGTALELLADWAERELSPVLETL